MLQIGIFLFFEITENEYFPFHGFVRHISGKSIYDIISGMKKFYDTLPKGKASVQSDGRYMEKEFVSAYCRRLVEAGVENKILKDVSDI